MTTQSGMQFDFSGCPEAQMFTREVHDSLDGVLAKNFQRSGTPGFVTASVDGRFWHDTMWTRDAGVFLREMAHWGYLEEGLLTARCLFNQVLPNNQGFEMFPMYFRAGEKASGSELDGTAAILIGSALLCERLSPADPARSEIWGYLNSPTSAVAGLLAAVSQSTLVAGSGEFGGGCGIEGDFFNVVQNNLVRLAFLAVARLAAAQGAPDLARQCREAAGRILAGMLADLTYPDGTWTWCRHAPDKSIDQDVLAHEINAGFGGINGVLAMSGDVLGLLPALQNEPWLKPSIQTFLYLLSQPSRLRQFSQWGTWTQFDRFWGGVLTGPSYGHGYAVQCMQLMDWPELYSPAINWLARATCQLLPGQVLHRDSEYWFYERYYSPEAVGKVDMEEGCGALNLVCVMEPLKIARLMLGVDDHRPAKIRLVPRLPVGWTRLEARHVPVLTEDRLALVDIDITATLEGEVQQASIRSDRTLPPLEVRLGTGRNPAWRSSKAEAEINLTI